MSKFKALTDYRSGEAGGYELLPIRFARLQSGKYVLANAAGEHLVVDRSTLENTVTHRITHADSIYADLKSKHFIKDHDSNVALDLLALKVRTKLQHLSHFTALHIFVVSLRCEHSCPYCQVSRQSDDRQAYDMSEETANRALALVFQSPSPYIKIEFQGGEPLLNFGLIQYIVRRAETINQSEKRSLQFVIATNLALISNEILEYCKDHDILISTSLDGPADLHNMNRPRPGRNSHELAVRGIDSCRKALGENRVSALMTTTEASLDRVVEIVDEYRSLGFKTIFLRPMSPYGFAVKTKTYAKYDGARWLAFYKAGLDYILELNRRGEPFSEQLAAIVLQKMLTPGSPGYVDLMSPSGIGISVLVYNYDGDVYASDEGRMLREMGDTRFRLGNVHVDDYKTIMLSDSLLDALEDSYTGSAPMCSECAYETYCGAEPVYHHATQGDVLGKKPLSEFCKRNTAIFDFLIQTMEDKAEAKRTFQGWAFQR